jgi:hypothetical protein
MKRTLLSFCAVLILAAFAVCQQPASNQPLVNDSIVEMVRAGLSEDIIIAKIQNAAANYDVSTSGLVSLGKEKVSDNIIKTMMEAQRNEDLRRAMPVAAPVVDSLDPNSPDAPHDPGIYLYTKASSGQRLILLEPTVYTQGKVGGVFTSAITYGIVKVKYRAVIRGANAQLRIDPSPVFYFYFEETNAGLSHSTFANSSPNEFTLQRFDRKENSRETVVMSANAYGATSGADEKKSVPFNFVKLRPGVYKVTPKVPLTPGEYGFIAAGHPMAPYPPPYGYPTYPRHVGVPLNSQVFDFGVN